MITPERLKELRELAENAMPGPWYTKKTSDRDFIVALNLQTVFELLDEIERLQKEISNFLTYGQGGASFKESQLLSKLYKAEAERDELRAQAAAMTEALELALPYVKDAMPDLRGHVCGQPDSVCDGECAEAAEIAGLIRKIERVLSTDAGRELLERMKKLELVAEAAREASKNGYANYLTKNVLFKALADLEKGE